MIALGLVARNWTLSACIESFKGLCQKAFTRRIGGNIPIVSFLVDNYHHSKYETTPLQKALQDAFTSDQYLFGGPRSDASEATVKVAVTTTLSSTSPVVLANYNRSCDEKCKRHEKRWTSDTDQLVPYQFQRAEGTDTELKTWEA